MPKDVQVKRGAFTWQWQTVPGAFHRPQAMQKVTEGDGYAWKGMQVATLRGVPDGMSYTAIMFALDRAMWVPGSEKLTELHWSTAENGRVQFLDAQGNRVAI